jgi:hypothetical protein
MLAQIAAIPFRRFRHFASKLNLKRWREHRLTDQKQDTARHYIPGRIIVDAAISVAVTLVLTAIVWGVIGSFDGMAMWLLIPFAMVIPVLLFGTPVVVVLWGLVKMRAGIVIGPLVFLAASLVWASHYSAASDRAVRAFATQSIEPASRPHHLLMTEGGDAHCDIACIRILASSSYSLARKNMRTSGWLLFRRGQGDDCLKGAERESMSTFRHAGFPDMCAIQTDLPDVLDGLLVRERHLPRSQSTAAVLPSAFGGSIYEIIERVDGKDRILGRRISGSMRLPVPNSVAVFSGGLITEEHIDIGPRIDPKEFLANVVGISTDKPYGQQEPFLRQ